VSRLDGLGILQFLLFFILEYKIACFSNFLFASDVLRLAICLFSLHVNTVLLFSLLCYIFEFLPLGSYHQYADENTKILLKMLLLSNHVQ